MNDVILYTTQDKKTEVAVRFDGDTVWLTQAQMATLFKQTKQNISLHINNCLKEKELSRSSVVKDSLITAADGKQYKTRLYNLDVIISVGYRVRSKRGTQFRQWATGRLRDYLVKGYAENQKRLEELQQTIRIISREGVSEHLQLDEARGLLKIISSYTHSFVLLNQYDSQRLTTGQLNEHITYEIKYAEARTAIAALKKQLAERNEASDLFGNEKDEGFKSSLQSIVQTFGGQYLYPSIEEQAAHLLYFVIKNHSFSDGNKRIGAFLFIWFLEKNNHRFKKSGELKVNDNGLTAIALLIAQSKPEEKELMIRLIINLIADQ